MRRVTTVMAVALTVLLAVPGTAFAQPPTNDDFDNATDVHTNEQGYFFDYVDTEEATRAPDDPSNCGGDLRLENTVWYRFRPSKSGLYYASSSISTFMPSVQVYTGSRGALTLLTCDDRVPWQANVGGTYYILVGSFDSEQPGGYLSFTLQGPLRVAITIDPTGRVDPRTGTVTLTGTVTCLGAPVATSGTLRQQAGRFTIHGEFGMSRPPCDEQPQPWIGEAEGENGIFAPGRAKVTVVAEVCPSSMYCRAATAEATIRLTR